MFFPPQESAVLQDVGGIRRVPGKRQKVSTRAAFVFKLCFVFRCVRGDASGNAHQWHYDTLLVIIPPQEGLRLDVALVPLY